MYSVFTIEWREPNICYSIDDNQFKHIFVENTYDYNYIEPWQCNMLQYRPSLKYFRRHFTMFNDLNYDKNVNNRCSKIKNITVC